MTDETTDRVETSALRNLKFHELNLTPAIDNFATLAERTRHLSLCDDSLSSFMPKQFEKHTKDDDRKATISNELIQKGKSPNSFFFFF